MAIGTGMVMAMGMVMAIVIMMVGYRSLRPVEIQSSKRNDVLHML